MIMLYTKVALVMIVGIATVFGIRWLGSKECGDE